MRVVESENQEEVEVLICPHCDWVGAAKATGVLLQLCALAVVTNEDVHKHWTNILCSIHLCIRHPREAFLMNLHPEELMHDLELSCASQDIFAHLVECATANSTSDHPMVAVI